ncbi:increased DNA methylation 3-like [Chenopodium quinoa]|uniref:SHSP domain-containing protein n=1 Tax=Chenopodium quinoa TaxID=63459 RepID=A0A803M6M5_CHEQI|nr:increased DNA methylation 3-like [Chenopodium quinoa]
MGENPTLQSKTDTTQVVLTGTARDGTAGPPIGHVDIGISESAYLFRVALPGVRKDNCDLSCEIERDGKVHLQGNITGGELAKKNPKTVYHLSLSQLSPPGPFSISFKLPGPVDPRLFSPTFRSDGILEGVVMKYKAPGVPPCGNQFDPAIPA